MKLAIINGPNLNLLGTRQPEIYGSETLDQKITELQRAYPSVEILAHQSNIEGEIVGWIQSLEVDGIILNAAAYTHTSVAIRDAISAVETPVVEVHLSNVTKRETFRHESMISPVCVGCIFGFGWEGYRLAIEHFLHRPQLKK